MDAAADPLPLDAGREEVEAFLSLRMAKNLMTGAPAARQKFIDRMKRAAILRAAEQMEGAA